MAEKDSQSVKRFQFRDLHPGVFLGTASDRYAGWIGQIYSDGRYERRLTPRTKKLAGRTFTEEVLPVESVAEYFQHFPVLEVDFTFYRPLLDKNLQPTQNYHVLNTYSQYLGPDDHVILKVPQAVFARKVHRAGSYTENPDYLDVELFVRQFYEPSLKILGDRIKAFIFEQEYQAKRDRPKTEAFTEQLGAFFARLPKDDRYHVEVRTGALLTQPYFEVLNTLGLGQVFSHWTWLPSLSNQFEKGGSRFYNAGNQCIIRLITPQKMRYEATYAMAHPFNKMIEGMMDPEMIDDTAGLMQEALRQGAETNVLINNRAGGNAPVIAQRIAEKFVELQS